MVLTLDVPVPSSAASCQAELCGVQWLLERRRDGVRCVAMDGEVLWEALLGLPEGRSLLRIRATVPRHPLEVELASETVLAPDGRVSGWIDAPLEFVLSVVDTSDETQEQELHVLEDKQLRTAWREQEGYHHPWRVALRRKPRKDARRMWLRMSIKNLGREPWRPQRCRLLLYGQELRALRDLVLGPRVAWTSAADESVRLLPLPGSGSADRARVLQPLFRRLGGTAS